MMTEVQYNQLKQQLKRLEESCSRTEGALDQLQRRITSEYGIKLTDINNTLKQWKSEHLSLERDFNLKVTQFMEKWGSLLKENEID